MPARFDETPTVGVVLNIIGILGVGRLFVLAARALTVTAVSAVGSAHVHPDHPLD